MSYNFHHRKVIELLTSILKLDENLVVIPEAFYEENTKFRSDLKIVKESENRRYFVEIQDITGAKTLADKLTDIKLKPNDELIIFFVMPGLEKLLTDKKITVRFVTDSNEAVTYLIQLSKQLSKDEAIIKAILKPKPMPYFRFYNDKGKNIGLVSGNWILSSLDNIEEDKY